MDTLNVKKNFRVEDGDKSLSVDLFLSDDNAFVVNLYAKGLSSLEAAGLFDHIVRPYFYDLRANIKDSYEGDSK